MMIFWQKTSPYILSVGMVQTGLNRSEHLFTHLAEHLFTTVVFGPQNDWSRRWLDSWEISWLSNTSRAIVNSKWIAPSFGNIGFANIGGPACKSVRYGMISAEGPWWDKTESHKLKVVGSNHTQVNSFRFNNAKESIQAKRSHAVLYDCLLLQLFHWLPSKNFLCGNGRLKNEPRKITYNLRGW